MMGAVIPGSVSGFNGWIRQEDFTMNDLVKTISLPRYWVTLPRYNHVFAFGCIKIQAVAQTEKLFLFAICWFLENILLYQPITFIVNNAIIIMYGFSYHSYIITIVI